MEQLPDTSGTTAGDDYGFDPITEGNYLLKITKCKTRISKSGKPWLKIWFKSESFPGYAWGDISLSPEKLKKLKQLKVAIGLGDAQTDTEALVGRQVWGHCKDDEGFASVDKYADTKEGLEAIEDEIDDDLPF